MREEMVVMVKMKAATKAQTSKETIFLLRLSLSLSNLPFNAFLRKLERSVPEISNPNIFLWVTVTTLMSQLAVP
ncbi:hypothetical protein F0562_030884 [Nyssa sinensis]|uniref:Uncharacterized protein n=1 Tax=Nyssa sinensis TaxID=561372 RepID=A0A5J5B439_9ASTE|nr:hypothetical protein F0562_030884 [Nyssa sinensis]